MDARSPQTGTTIFVDLDGTLIHSDLLWETLFQAARQKPRVMLQVPGWIAAGKARLKAELAHAVDFDPALLPYREEVVERLRRARADGRRIVLATGANEKLAHAVADHLGLFDAVMCSCDTVNLTAHRKLDRILDECGEVGFDYVGNSHEDICLLDKAAEALVVAPDRAAARWQKRSGAERIDDPGSRLRPALRAMRPHQWLKNVLIFVPMVLTHEFFNIEMLVGAMLAFISFSFAASAVYILNDLLDLTADRRHRTKRNRPFASGALAIPTGITLAAVLLGTSLGIGLFLPDYYLLVLGVYLVTTTAYSFALKRMLLIDVLTLAGLYTMRIVAGSEASGVETSFWLLAFSLFFFLSLALVKRFTELQDFGIGAERATTGRGYVDADLETLGQAGMASGFASVLVLALYIDSMEGAEQYTEPFLVWPLCPLVLYIIVRIWILARRNQMHEDPVVFIMSDWRSQVMIAGGGLLFLLAAIV
ncbi:UbiA prenyltransferase family protein [Aurantimonas manganoxydans SI85-9A1]|uniref:UbiA prenyltransferase family protein n=1 Tax=Aurantimonas manganoxydans (strain ATCC BAA-1229 / DSM 21871 / SI85-9A1) TaxID=287752 RepID=Q1YMC5_AURMS|nr:UbiA family prenyltransferase [Aurantimonas manganoxydans]EAS51456.1 UbiA prenyltransferase family protein [Aurantimonas manganoxydans SI85-9A1]